MQSYFVLRWTLKENVFNSAVSLPINQLLWLLKCLDTNLSVTSFNFRRGRIYFALLLGALLLTIQKQWEDIYLPEIHWDMFYFHNNVDNKIFSFYQIMTLYMHMT